MKIIRIENRNQPLPAPLQAIYCDSFCCHLRGFMFRSSLAPEEGLVLVEKRDSRLDTSIHMLFVNTDLAVIWINSEFNVVDTVVARSWRSAYAPRQPARFTLEIHPSRLHEFKIGDHIEFQHA
jgi:uncharacterized membrane protein (UPF0127 family)